MYGGNDHAMLNPKGTIDCMLISLVFISTLFAIAFIVSGTPLGTGQSPLQRSGRRVDFRVSYVGKTLN